MSYRIFDYRCNECQQIVEEFVDVSEADDIYCPVCASPMKRLISFGAGSIQSENSSWLPSVLEVVDKNSTKPHVRAFLAEPTRTNYRRWMKGEGIRPLCEGEAHANRTMQREREADMERGLTEGAMRRLQERRRIEV